MKIIIKINDLESAPISVEDLIERVKYAGLNLKAIARRSDSAEWSTVEAFLPAGTLADRSIANIRPETSLDAGKSISKSVAKKSTPGKNYSENRKELSLEIRAQIFPDQNSKNYFIRHWKGQLSLSKAYWINAVLINTVIAFLFFVGLYLSEIRDLSSYSSWSLAASSALIILAFISYPIITVWQSVGVYRCAAKSNWFIKSYVQGTASIAAFNCFVNLFGFFPILIDSITVINGDRSIPDFSINVTQGGKTIEFHGGIKLGAASHLKKVLSENPNVNTLQIETVGGRVAEAISIAREVKNHHLNTYVSGICASSGTWVFLAGKERLLHKNGQLGFHAPALSGKKVSNRMNFRFNELYVKEGVSRNFIEQVTSSLEMTWPTNETLLKEKIVTKIVE
jgi:hypothetical protein